MNNKYSYQHRLCWCGSQDWNEVFRTLKFGLLECRSCTSYTIDPPPITSDVESETFYSQYYEHRNNNYGSLANNLSSRFWKVVQQVPNLSIPGDNVIDIGCGNGDLAIELKRSGWKNVIGVDVSKPRIAIARTRSPEITFFDVPLEKTNIPSNHAELAILDNVIEHIPDPVVFLRSLRTYMEPQGKIVVITPNMCSGNFKFLGRWWTPELAPHAHIFLFTPKAMRNCLKAAGFNTVHEGTFHLPILNSSQVANDLIKGRFKHALWRLGQASGNCYSYAINSGPMLFAVATLSKDSL
jgi:2-polyprenyl-3-methyl-5-hydroxy-6-metoxy-1,4-benzoquinol methylase